MGSQCKLVIKQLPGGSVMDATVVEPCALDEAGRRSVEAAVLKAQPLPYAGFEKVFNRQLNFTFRAEKR
jgi:colicin import membrane protein